MTAVGEIVAPAGLATADARRRRTRPGLGALVRRGLRVVDPLALVAPIATILVWQLVVEWKIVESQYLPEPLEVWNAAWAWVFGDSTTPALYNGTWTEHAWASTVRVLYGFAVGSAAGAVVGCIIGWSRIGARIFDPLVQILRPIPITAWLPFVVVFLGTEGTSAVALIAIGAFFPVVVNTVAGLRSVDELLLRAAQMLGCRSRARQLVRVGIPAAAPSIFTGLRISAGLSWVLVIVAEMIAVKSGFGYVMWDAYYFLRMDVIVAAMLSVGIMGFVFDRLVVLVQGGVCSWTRQ
jgi:NitT/TauT family transport system permease protein